MQPDKLVCALCLALSSGAISIGTHQPIADVRSNGGDIRVEYSMPYAGWGKLLSFSFVIGSGVFLSLGLKPNNAFLLNPAICEKTTNRVIKAVKNNAPPNSNSTTEILIEQSNMTQESVLEQIDLEGSQLLEPPLNQEKSVKEQTDAKPKLSFFELLRTHKKKHTFFPCETGVGKTTALLGAIKHIHEEDKSAIFLGSTAKPTAWGGLEKIKWEEDGKSCVLNISNKDFYSIEMLRDRLVAANIVMERRQLQRQAAEQRGEECHFPPIYLILDEWLRTLNIAENYDQVQNQEKAPGDPSSNIQGEIIRIINDFVFAGREDNVIVWLFGQDHQCQNSKINTGSWKNFGFVILAVPGYLTSIQDALYGRSPIIQGAKLKEQIWKEVIEFEGQAETSGSFAYTNLVGHQVLPLPYLPDIKKERIFLNPSNVVGFSRKEETFDDVWV
jgi:hypothetical protein